MTSLSATDRPWWRLEPNHQAGKVSAWARFFAPRIRALGRMRVVVCALALAQVCLLVFSGSPASALEAIVVNASDDRIEITAHGELYNNRGDRFQVETAAGSDGVAGRMSVSAQVPGTDPSWLVFALTNPTEQRIERWLTADRYSLVGSRALWPDLDARRIEAVTPSIGFLPEPIKSDRADVFRITLEPGQTITYVAELTSDRYARVFLWKPLAYELKVRERQLFNGVLLGLTGLLAIFLTAIFAANHKVIFPSAALVAWCVLAYLCIEFGFFHKLFNLRPEDNAVYRAAGEAAIAGSLVIFLYTFLRLGLGHSIIRMLFGVWILAQLALVAVAVVDPRLAATFARLSFLLIGAVGTISTLYLSFLGQDRAISLIPTWILFLVWIFAAAVTLTGRLSGEVAVAALIAGLVLVVLLIGFTVTQFAFRSLQPHHGSSVGEQQLQSLAVDGAGAATWEWNDRRNEVRISPIVETSLGLNSGELSTKVDDFIGHINPNDRDRFRLMLWSVQERGGGQLRIDFRLRASDNTYRWFDLEAASVETADRRSIRCVGLLRDITDVKRSQERLLHDAVHCSLTGLPNRELFVDRLSVAMQRASVGEGGRPTVLFVDIDKFKSVNNAMGLVVGDSLLLTIARRMKRHLDGHDTLSRIGGDQFAILLLSEQEPRELAALAERIRRSLRSPINIAGREVVLTGSIGIAIYDGEEESHLDLLKEAEIAMYRAKRSGADRIEIFSPQMRGERDDRVTIESDLREALQKNQIKVLFQPIVYLPTEELAGFEALVRWEHPKSGLLNPDAFVPVAEQSDLIVQLGSYVLKNSVQTLARWQKVLPRSDAPLFLSVNISNRQLMGPELISQVKQISMRSTLRPGSLRLEITESLAMSNPEQAVERMEQIHASGAEIALDDFGTGFSSLAYLERFPIDTIKLDRSFVQSSSDSDRAQSAIVRSMVALAHELGKSVVAEGVEEPRDAAFLRSIGCEYAQGFYYGEAMSEADALELLHIICKSERKLRSQGFFRPKSKKPKEKAKPQKTDEGKEKVRVAATAGGDRAKGESARVGVAGAGRNGATPPAQPPAPPPLAATNPARSQSREQGTKPVSIGRVVRNIPASPPLPNGQANQANKSPDWAKPVPGDQPVGPSANAQGGPTPNVFQPSGSPHVKRGNGVPPIPGGAPSNRPASSNAPVDIKAPATPATAAPPVLSQAPQASGHKQERGSAKSPQQNSGIGALLDALPPLAEDKPGKTNRSEINQTPSHVDDRRKTVLVDQGFPTSKGDDENNPKQLASSGLEQAELSSLPPGIASSLARLAGTTSGHGAGGPRRLSEGGSVRPGGSRARQNPTEED